MPVPEPVTKTRRRGPSEAVLVAAAPALGYALAFLYELGYTRHFAIPFEFISISLTNVFVALGLISPVLLWVLYLELGPSGSWLDISSAIPRDPIGYVQLKLYPLTLFSTAMLAVFLFFQEWVYAVAGVIAAFVWFLYLKIWPLIRYRQKDNKRLSAQESFEAHFKAQEEKRGFNFVLNRLIEAGVFLPAAAVCIALATAYIVGSARAKHQETFFLPTQSSDFVALRVYGDTILVAPFDRSSRRVERTLYVRKLGSDEAIGLREEKVGPLTLADEDD